MSGEPTTAAGCVHGVSLRVSEQLTANAEAIDAELIAVQGSPADIGGYYHPDAAKASAVMRPSATFNGILAALA